MKLLTLLVIICIITNVLGYFEVLIDRKSDEPHIDLSDKVTNTP